MILSQESGPLDLSLGLGLIRKPSCRGKSFALFFPCNTLLYGPIADLDSIGEVKFLQDVADVRFDRLDADDQLFSNRLIGQPLRQERQHLFFAGRQPWLEFAGCDPTPGDDQVVGQFAVDALVQVGQSQL